MADKRWAIQYEMECQGFKYDSSEGESDMETASPHENRSLSKQRRSDEVLSVEAGASVANLKVSDTDYVGIRRWNANVDMPSNPLALDARAAQAAIRNHGLYLHGVATR